MAAIGYVKAWVVSTKFGTTRFDAEEHPNLTAATDAQGTLVVQSGGYQLLMASRPWEIKTIT